MNDSHEKTWEIYTAAWKAETADQKQALFQQSLARTSVYTDPLTQTTGWEELCAYMLEFHQQIPGGHFVTNYFLSHHNKSIAKWNMCDADDNVVGEGVSYGEYDKDNRLVAMTGFYDTPQE